MMLLTQLPGHIWCCDKVLSDLACLLKRLVVVIFVDDEVVLVKMTLVFFPYHTSGRLFKQAILVQMILSLARWIM